MTISAYTGLPGHGKSYGVVDNVIIPALKNKRTIFTNIPMNKDVVRERYNVEVIQYTIDDIIDNKEWFSKVFISGSLIIMDELWRLWPSGLKANQVDHSHKEFLAEHRHLVGTDGLSTEIVFVTQDLSQIASFARTLVENTFHVNKLSSLPLKKPYRVDVYYGCVTGVSPPKSKRVREIYGTFKKEVFELYKSHTKSETGQAGNEDRTDNRFNQLSGALPKIYLIVIIFSVIGSYYALRNLFVTEKVTITESESTLHDAKKQTQESEQINLINYDNRLKENTKKIEAQYQQQLQSKINEIKEAQTKEFLYRTKYIAITFNNGIFPSIDYKFNLYFEDTDIQLDQEILESLGYEIKPITSCLVEIKNEHYQTYAKCYPEELQQTFIESIVSG